MRHHQLVAGGQVPGAVVLLEQLAPAVLVRTHDGYRFVKATRPTSGSTTTSSTTAPRIWSVRSEGAAIAACLARAIDAAFAPIGGVTVLHQPPETVAHGFTTARAYTRDAVRVDGDTAQHAADLLHVGPAFGAQVLARVYAELEAFATA